MTDLVQRDFTAHSSDEKGGEDITYVPTDEGWAYVATVLDCYSRNLVGWKLDTHMRTELVTDALQDTLARRTPSDTIFHTDRGRRNSEDEFTKLTLTAAW